MEHAVERVARQKGAKPPGCLHGKEFRLSRVSRNVQVADAALAPQESRLADTLLFTKKLLAKGRAIAAISPSGLTISRAMARQVDFSQPGVIVELGAGTG